MFFAQAPAKKCQITSVNLDSRMKGYDGMVQLTNKTGWPNHFELL